MCFTITSVSIVSGISEVHVQVYSKQENDGSIVHVVIPPDLQVALTTSVLLQDLSSVSSACCVSHERHQSCALSALSY